MLLDFRSLSFISLETSKWEEKVLTSKKSAAEKFMSTRVACMKVQGQGIKHRHFVLVHGACHGAWCWYKVSSLLQSAGHNVTALDMAASGVHPKQVHELHSFSDYFEPLTEFMESLPLEEGVVLVGHSMSGIGIAAAMEMFPHKISAAVFASAVMPGPDLDFKAIAQKYAQRSVSGMDTIFVYGNGTNNPPTASVLGPNYMASKLYRLSPPEDLLLAKMLLRPFPLFGEEANQRAAILTKEKYGSVRRVYIVFSEDHDDSKRWMIEENPPDEVKVIPDSDHMAMFCKPQELCSCLQEIGLKYV